MADSNTTGVPAVTSSCTELESSKLPLVNSPEYISQSPDAIASVFVKSTVILQVATPEATDLTLASPASPALLFLMTLPMSVDAHDPLPRVNSIDPPVVAAESVLRNKQSLLA